MEGWRKFARRFELAVIGAGLKRNVTGEATAKKKNSAADETAEAAAVFDLEQRKAALLLDSMRDYGMEIFETWTYR